MALRVASEVVSRELRAYFRWLTVLEGMGKREGAGVSRWYKSPFMHCYTRAGVMRGWDYEKPVVCLANIQLHKAIRGHGIFSEIVRKLQDGADKFELHRIEIECVNNPGLADWLTRATFQRYPQPSDGAPSTTFYLDVKS
ncbi:hypothetical protein [Paraburkholderia phenoliruptrix]|uniref:hypothetical protein n=1 Tax=Paraburkholderia phenoliruptrix TaxID=252970 RepID=UPI0001C02FC3|nr:hypothetical protein [Paraburkholderia phenoliruptrix]MDR6392263.1 hypothetical protein [Paraburkholderia phenoliruptrix]